MALILKDRVKESSTSSGTGSITLGGAFPGYQTFNAAIASGSTVYYTIHNLTAGFDTEWEVGVGTFTSPATLSRDTVLSSSTGSLINFTAGVNGLEVFITQPAEEAIYINQATGKVEAFGNGANTITFTNINASNVVMVSGTISTNASNATDITNKTYVDGLFSTGVSYHEAVKYEVPNTTGNLTAVYVQPGGPGNGIGATLTNAGTQTAFTPDGIVAQAGDRILVYNQTNAFENGVYTVTTVGSGSTNWVLTRATDADTFGLADPNALGAGDAFFVTSGNTGAGETYVCNTQGTITFGTTGITFAQISSAQVYAAGTGLNLANLTFSIANTAVTAATYGNDGAVAQFTVNAQGQLTNASNVSINASSITIGTLANDRTTANPANSVSTIVARDTTGSFNANVVTATTVNATNGNFTTITANAAGLTDINASNISSGTISNARTTGNTANSASTIVLRDSNGNFGSNVISAASFSGDGTAITAINASNISSGTISNSRTTAASANGASTIVLRDANGDFAADAITANFFIGDGSNVSALNGSNVTTGTIANARTTANSSNGASTIVLRDAGGAFAAGAITATSVSGNGSALTAINASSISTGTLDNARTTASSSNGANTIVLRDASGDFSVDGITANWFTGNGANLSAINASNISSGTVASARISGSYTGITGVGTLTAGTWNANSISTTYTDAKVTSVSAGTGISVNATTGAVTVTNGGVTSAVAGTGVSVSGSTGAVTFSIGQAVATGSSVQFGSFGVGTAASGTTGEIRATNNITAYFSDERLKTKIGDIENALDKVKQIQTMVYHPNETAVALGYDASVIEVGVTAQSVQKVQPQVVAPAPIDDKYLTVRYERLVPLLIEAIKELEAQVAELKAR